MKITKTILITINILLLVSQLAVSHFRATDGDQVAALESQTAALSSTNLLLQSQINSLSSLHHISQAASSQNLTPLPVSTLDPSLVALAP